MIATALAMSTISSQASDAPKSGKIQYDHPRILEMCRYHQNKTGILLDGKEICEYSQEDRLDWWSITIIGMSVVGILGLWGYTFISLRRREEEEKKKKAEKELADYQERLKKQREIIKSSCNTKWIPTVEEYSSKIIAESDIGHTNNQTWEHNSETTEEIIKHERDMLENSQNETVYHQEYKVVNPVSITDEIDIHIIESIDLNLLKAELQGTTLMWEELEIAHGYVSENPDIIGVKQKNRTTKYGFDIKYQKEECIMTLSSKDEENNKLYYLNEDGMVECTTEYAFHWMLGFQHLDNGYFRIILPDYTTQKIFLQWTQY